MSATNILMIFAIFSAKIIEISLSSVKFVFLVKRQRLFATLFSFAEILVWAFIVSGIIDSLTSNLYWLFAYCFGYALGVYVGSIIEDKIALGTICVQIITSFQNESKIISYLNQYKYGYTIVQGQGSKEKNSIIMCIIKKRKSAPVIKAIKNMCDDDIFIFTSDISGTIGGVNINRAQACK